MSVWQVETSADPLTIQNTCFGDCGNVLSKLPKLYTNGMTDTKPLFGSQKKKNTGEVSQIKSVSPFVF